MWCGSGARLINFPRTWGEQMTNFPWTWGEQRTLVRGKDIWRIQFSLCSRKEPTNFSSQWTVCEPFAEDAAQVRSPVHTYLHLVREWFSLVCEWFGNHLARLCIRGFMCHISTTCLGGILAPSGVWCHTCHIGTTWLGANLAPPGPWCCMCPNGKTCPPES